MLHVKLVLVGEVLVDASLAKHRVNFIVLAEENVAENFLAVELLALLGEDFFAVLVDKAARKV
jgi:hypothetical protein